MSDNFIRELLEAATKGDEFNKFVSKVILFANADEAHEHIRRYQNLKKGDMVWFQHPKYGVIPGIVSNHTADYGRVNVLYYDPDDIHDHDIGNAALVCKSVILDDPGK